VRLLAKVEALRGEELVLVGPRGIGKSTLLARLSQRLHGRGIAVGSSAETTALADIVAAAARAYRNAAVEDVSARRVRGRLRLAAETKPAVLLLDHLARATAPMRSFLRTLRGKGVGVLFAVDVDAARDRDELRSWRLTHHELRMPPWLGTSLRRLLEEHEFDERFTGRLHASAAREIVEAAQGRPGWIVECAARLREPRFWSDEAPRLGLLRAEVGAHMLAGYLRVEREPS
jgi:energy-coupling factor transporter ATP-binding protein EcfA2